MTRVILRTPLFAALCLTLALGSLGCPSGPPCAIPATSDNAVDLLSGTWVVRTYDGTLDGEITFDGGDIETRWQEVTLLGSWAHLSSSDNALVIRLTIEEAIENGVRQLYGTLDEVDLELVFASQTHLYALQSDGVWTEWEQVPAAAE